MNDKSKYLVMRDREVMLTPVYWNSENQTSQRGGELYGIEPKVIWDYFSKGRIRAIRLRADWDKVAEYIAEKLFLEKEYFEKVVIKKIEKLNKAEKFYKEVMMVDFGKLSFSELIDTVKTLKTVWLEYDFTNVPAWFYASECFGDLLRDRLNIGKEEFLILTTPFIKTAISQYEHNLLRSLVKIKTKKGSVENIAKMLCKKYGWIPFGYDGPVYWDEQYFINLLKKNNRKNISEIQKEIKKIVVADKENRAAKNRIIKKYRLGEEDLRLAGLANTMAVWTDERKNIEFRLHYIYSRILTEIGKRFGLSYKQLKYLFTEELEGIEKNKEILKRKANWRINNDFILEYRKGKIRQLSNHKMKKLIREIEPSEDSHVIKGTVASKGKKQIYKGTVKILLSPSEGGKIRKGDFLVATMTSPDYILPMKKAAGFITNEGGVTCHAAIVAREMKKPCIIGTKIATQVLKDGDLVEVDADRGVVRILEK